MSLFCKYRLNEIFIFTWDENVKLCCSFGSWFITFREFLLKCLLQCFSRTLKFLYKVSGMLFIIFLCLYGCPFSFWIVPFFLILFSVIFPFEFFFFLFLFFKRFILFFLYNLEEEYWKIFKIRQYSYTDIVSLNMGFFSHKLKNFNKIIRALCL